jgi:hypothetical protein
MNEPVVPTATAPQPQPATVHGKVTYTPGDGAPILIPEGLIEVIDSGDSATLSWSTADDVTGSASLPRDQFDKYVKDGKIRLGT